MPDLLAASGNVLDYHARRRGDRELSRLVRALAAAIPELPPDVILTAENWEAYAPGNI